jgi:HAD superfamily hydrolase (TIGR01509 family)
MYKAILFDLDGVLTDSQPLHYDVDIAVMSALGVQINEATVQNYAGMRTHDRFLAFKRDFFLSDDINDIVNIHVNTMRDKLSLADVVPISGVRETLKRLKDEGMTMLVASSSSIDFIESILIKMDIRHYFDHIVSGESMAHGKPAPDIFIEAAKRSGQHKESCVVIEDSANGVKAAVAAGIDCIGYINESSGVQDLSGAIAVFDNFESILGFILGNQVRH